jgi:hypothetical protein
MYATITITVLTESGARYLLRQHKERLYVTRLGDRTVSALSDSPVNRVTTLRVPVIGKGKPMHIRFSDGGYDLFTTPVVDFSYRVDRYLA